MVRPVSALTTFITIRDRLASDLKDISRLTTSGNDGQTEREILFLREDDVKNLYNAGISVRKQADRTSDGGGGVTLYSVDKFFRRIVGDGPDDSRARIFSIVLFSNVDPRTTLWSNFLDSLRLDNEAVSLATFRDKYLPLPSDAIDRWFGTDNEEVFNREQHENYPVDRTSRFDACLQELQTSIRTKQVQCKVRDHNDERCSPELLDTFYPCSTSHNFVAENRKLILQLYIESVKAKPRFSDRARVGNLVAYHQLQNARAEAGNFYIGVCSCSKAFAVLVLMSVSSHSEMWLRFEAKCRGSSLEFENNHFPLSLKNAKEAVGNERYEEYYDCQFRFCAPVLREGEQQIFAYPDRVLRLPLAEKKKIGEGATGKVFRVKVEPSHFEPSGQILYLAMKQMPLTAISGNELLTLSFFKDQPWEPKAIMLPRVCLQSEDNRIFIFSDLADSDLETYMKNENITGNEPRDIEKTKKLLDQMVDIAYALEYLHDRMVQKVWHERMVLYHLDIKASNVLVFKDNNGLHFKLTDFGISTVKVPPEGWKVGDRSTPIKYQRTSAQLGDGNSNAPPEKDVDSRADIWAFGTLLARFLVWLAKGYQSLEEFDTIRGVDANGRSIGMEFFHIRPNTQEPYLKDSVAQFFEGLVERTPTHNGKGKRQLYESTWWLLQHKLLVCNPDDRADIRKVWRSLRAILKSTPLEYIKRYLDIHSQQAEADEQLDRVASGELQERPFEVRSQNSSDKVKDPSANDPSLPLGNTSDEGFRRLGRKERLDSNASIATAWTAPEPMLGMRPSRSIESSVLTPASTDPQGSRKNEVQILSNRKELAGAIESNSMGRFQRALDRLSNSDLGHRSDGYQFLEQTVTSGNLDMTRQLLERGAGRKNIHGRLLHKACMAGMLEMIDLLIRYGVEINATYHGMTALSKICKDPPDDFHRTLRHLLDYDKINLEEADGSGATPLIRVASQGDFTAVSLLTRKGAKLSVQDSYDYSPLHQAIRFRGALVKEYILDPAPGLVSLKTKRGRTALHLCADLGSEEALENAQILLNANDDVNAKDGAGQTPLDLASRKSVIPPHTQMVELLCNNGAFITDTIKNDPDRQQFEEIRKRLKASSKSSSSRR